MRPTIEEIRNVSNYTDVYRWNLIFASFPVIGTLGNILPWPSSNDLNIRCESTTMPKVTNEKILVNIKGQKVYQSGQATYSSTLQLNFVDTVDVKIQNFFNTWTQVVWQTRTGISQPKLRQEATIILHQLNSLDIPIYQFTLYGCFMTDFDNGSMSSASEVRKPTATLSYDYYEFSSSV